MRPATARQKPFARFLGSLMDPPWTFHADCGLVAVGHRPALLPAGRGPALPGHEPFASDSTQPLAFFQGGWLTLLATAFAVASDCASASAISTSPCGCGTRSRGSSGLPAHESPSERNSFDLSAVESHPSLPASVPPKPMLTATLAAARLHSVLSLVSCEGLLGRRTTGLVEVASQIVCQM
jgi:hypothetical protein